MSEPTVIIAPNETFVTVSGQNRATVTICPCSSTPSPSPSGSTTLTYSSSRIAAIALSALRVVALSAGQLIYADSGNQNHAFGVVGIVLSAVEQGTAIAPVTEGSIADSSWNWTLNQPIFLGANGVLTQSPPSSGFLLQVAIPTTPTSIEFEIQEPIFL